MAHIDHTRLNHTPARLLSWNCKRAAMTLAALTAGFLATAAHPALAAMQANIKSISFSTQSAFNQVIHVVSTDKQKWNQIKPGSVQFWGHMQIDTKWPGFIMGVAVKLGQCGKHTCSTFPTVFVDETVKQRDYSNQRNFAVSTSKIKPSSGGIPLVPYGDDIIGKCNQHLSAGGPTKPYSFDYEMTATFGADTGKHVGNLDEIPSEVSDPQNPDISQYDYVAFDKFKVKVMCDPVIKAPVGDVAAKEPKDLSVGSIELFRATYSNVTSQPNPGTMCKKARWLVRLTTNKAGPVKFKLWLKNGDASMTSKVVDAWSTFDGNSKYQAEYAEWTEVSKTSVVQGMAEELTNPIGQSTGWKSITLHCSGPGGGLADKPKPYNDGPVTQPLKLTGGLTLADSAANSDKPRPGQAVFKIWATKPGSTSFRLTCSGGRQWEGTLPTFKVADNKYQAAGAQNFQVTKTEQIGCALWSTSTSPNGVIALATKLFRVDNPNTAGDDKTAPDRKPQTDSAPKRPVKADITVAPVPKLSCFGGKVSGKSCFCPRRSKKLKAGPNAYRCVKTVDAAEKRREAVTERRRKAIERLKELRQQHRQKAWDVRTVTTTRVR